MEADDRNAGTCQLRKFRSLVDFVAPEPRPVLINRQAHSEYQNQPSVHESTHAHSNFCMPAPVVRGSPRSKAQALVA